MQGLPSMIYGDGISKKQQIRFGGYNHTASAADGEIWDMQNLTSDYYPLLAPRKPKYFLWDDKNITDCAIFFADHKDGGRRMYLTERNALHRVEDDGNLVLIGELPEGTEGVMRSFATLGQYVIILPDKVALNTKTEKLERLEAKWEGTAKLTDGTYKGETAKANTVFAEGVNWSDYFKAGDAVRFEGWSEEKNNATLIIRETEGEKLRFYENSFSFSGTEWEEGGIGIFREVPDMDFICENENRLWGCKGKTIYASKLGDPFNWNVFDGVATDSYAADTGSAGDFTGCISFLGYPCFFKEEHIYKVYGDRPANFQIMGNAALGVKKGSSRSLAIVGGTLFYFSRTGVMAYSGGMPTSLAEPFGDEKYTEACAGSDGVKYYAEMRGEDEKGLKSRFFVYDTRYNLWHVEVRNGAKMFAYENGALWGISQWRIVTLVNDEYVEKERKAELWRYVGSGDTVQGDETFSAWAEFADFTETDPNRKGVSKLQLRAELSEGAKFSVYIQYDSDGEWRLVKKLTADRKKSFYLPIIPRRCDHYRIKVQGQGDWKLHSLIRETYSGSEI